MTEQANIDVIKSAYAAFTRGDLAAILELVSPRLERWGVIANARTHAPWHAVQGRSKQDVPAYFAAVLDTLEPKKFQPSAFAAAGAYVYATIEMEYTVRASGKTLVMGEVVHRFKLDHGRIVEAVIFEDTAHSLEVLAER